MSLLRCLVTSAVRAAPSATRGRSTGLVAERVKGFAPTVFAVYTPLALQTGAVNLGQGFPDFPADEWIKNAACKAVTNNFNQYTRPNGHPRLSNALAKTYSPLHNREINPDKEVLVHTGCTEAIFSATQAFVNPGEEVILFEPFYDCYPSAVTMAGGKPVFVPMKIGSEPTAASWSVDVNALESAVTKNTKAIMINNPHNPTGKVFSRKELEEIAAVAKKHDLLVISDEAYEFMVYDNVEHVRIASLPGMWERTVSLGSAGKTFSVTGWKIGWTIAHPDLAHAMLMAHQWIPYCVATPLQEAVAEAFEMAESQNYWAEFRGLFQRKRDFLFDTLQQAGLEPVQPQGSYFILTNTQGVQKEYASEIKTRFTNQDWNVAHWFAEEAGVVAIPPSAFYSQPNQHLVKDFARFTFCKEDHVLEAARDRLLAKFTK